MHKKKVFMYFMMIVMIVLLTACDVVKKPLQLYVDDQGLRYELTEDHTYRVSYGESTEKEVVVLSHINEYPVTEVKAGGFEGLDIDKITLPETIQSIHEYAFHQSNLRHVIFSGESQLSLIGISAFSLSIYLTDITIPKSVVTIESFAFYITGLKTVIFESDSALKIIGNDAFRETFIKEITIPKSVEVISPLAFFKTPLENVFFESGSVLESIESSAFQQTLIQAIDLPDSITSLEDSVFSLTPLKSLYLPKSLQSINRFTFSGLFLLETLTVDPDNPYFTSLDHVLFSKDLKRLIYFPESLPITTYQMPDDVEIIGEYALAGTTNLNRIVFGEHSNLKEIEYRAFSNSGIQTMILPESLEIIGAYAFQYSQLTSLNLPVRLRIIDIGFIWPSAITELYYRGSEEDFQIQVYTYGNWNIDNIPIKFNYEDES